MCRPRNCFRKAGIYDRRQQPAASDHDEEEENDASIQDVTNEMNALNICREAKGTTLYY